MPPSTASCVGPPAAYMRRERRDHTLQPTALVHEAYLRLIGEQDVRWEDRGHFFGIAARAMRQILVDHARKRGAGKRKMLAPIGACRRSPTRPVARTSMCSLCTRLSTSWPASIRDRPRLSNCATSAA